MSNRSFLLQPLEEWETNFIMFRARVHFAFKVSIREVHESFWSKWRPRSLPELREGISKFWRYRGWRDGTGFLFLKMTEKVLEEENLKPVFKDQVVIESRVS